MYLRLSCKNPVKKNETINKNNNLKRKGILD